jgi:hypothetical protein
VYGECFLYSEDMHAGLLQDLTQATAEQDRCGDGGGGGGGA